MSKSKKSLLGVSGYNKPKRTPSHPKKSHVVLAKKGDVIKTIRFGQQGVSGEGNKAKGKKGRARKKSFRARHKCSSNTDILSAAYWACKVKW